MILTGCKVNLATLRSKMSAYIKDWKLEALMMVKLYREKRNIHTNQHDEVKIHSVTDRNSFEKSEAGCSHAARPSTGNFTNSNSKANDPCISDQPHGVKPRLYVCTVCDKWFIAKIHMMGHMKRHTGEKYSCTQCEKCFSSQGALTSHKNIHAGKYKCTVCGECWPSSKHLATHRRSYSG